MKIYFNRAEIITAMEGACLLLMGVIDQLKGEGIIASGKLEIFPLVVFAFGAAFISRLFTPSSRVVPASVTKPRKTKWNMPPDQAFDKLKQFMASAAVQNSAKGNQDWQPVTLDKEKGLLEYKRTVEDYSDELMKPGRLYGDMTLTIQLARKENFTEVTSAFKVLANLTTLRIMEVASEANKRIDKAKTE